MRKMIVVASMPFLAGFIWFGLQSNSPIAAEAKAPAHRKLEYIRKFWHDLDVTQDGQVKGLNDLGSKGWELCGMVPSTDPQDPLVVLKRPAE